MNYTTIGVDVSKQKLDIYLLPTGEIREYSNDIKGFKQMKKDFASDKLEKIVMESTGIYHRQFARFWVDNNVDVYVVNPCQIKNFARVLNKKAKTDRIDSEVIAKFGEFMSLSDKKIKDYSLETLKEYITYRQQLVDSIVKNKGTLEATINPQVQKMIKQTIAYLTKCLDNIKNKIKEFIKEHKELEQKYNFLLSHTGVGEVLATVLIAELPELGHLNKREIAALVGIAPMNRDSGQMKGKRMIIGGRKLVRNALYMATLNSIRHNSVLSEFYNRLVEKGKSKKLAIVACMRKFIIYLNSRTKVEFFA